MFCHFKLDEVDIIRFIIVEQHRHSEESISARDIFVVPEMNGEESLSDLEAHDLSFI